VPASGFRPTVLGLDTRVCPSVNMVRFALDTSDHNVPIPGPICLLCLALHIFCYYYYVYCGCHGVDVWNILVGIAYWSLTVESRVCAWCQQCRSLIQTILIQPWTALRAGLALPCPATHSISAHLATLWGPSLDRHCYDLYRPIFVRLHLELLSVLFVGLRSP